MYNDVFKYMEYEIHAVKWSRNAGDMMLSILQLRQFKTVDNSKIQK